MSEEDLRIIIPSGVHACQSYVELTGKHACETIAQSLRMPLASSRRKLCRLQSVTNPAQLDPDHFVRQYLWLCVFLNGKPHIRSWGTHVMPTI